MIVVWWGTNVYRQPVGLRLLDVSTGTHLMGFSTSAERFIAARSAARSGSLPPAALPQPRELDARERDEVKRQRLLIEEHARAGKLPPETRAALIRLPFQLMNIAVASRGREKKMDRATALALAATIAVPFIVGFANCAEKGDTKNWNDTRTFAFFIPPVVLALFTAIVAAGEPKRFARKAVLAKVAHALQPLAPSPLEIRRALEDLRADGYVLAEHLNAADVSAALQATP